MKILITGVGSLLGQNILDALESRRPGIKVLGTNAIADNARIFRCDRAYKVPWEYEEGWAEAIATIIRKEGPDVVLPGRDTDALMLSKLKAAIPEFKNCILQGSAEIPAIFLDKHKSFKFASENGLPFADSLMLDDSLEEGSLDDFILRHSFPLVAKPLTGFGSNGVFFVRDRAEILANLERGDCVLQEFLNKPDDLDSLFPNPALGLPLFFQIPEKSQVAAQSIIYPDGRLAPICITNNTNVLGRTEYTEPFQDDELESLTADYAKIIYEHGWAGSMNLQVKKDISGLWKVFEMNPRMTGSTSARLLLGYDEIGMLINAFRPELGFRDLSHELSSTSRIMRTLTDDLVDESECIKFEDEGTWAKEKDE